MCITDFLVNEFKFRVVKGAKSNVIQRGRWVWRCWEPMLWVNWSVIFSFPWLLFLQAPLSLEMQTLQYRVGSAWDPPSVGETHTVFVCQPLPCLSTRCQQCPRRLAGCAVPPWEFTKQHKQSGSKCTAALLESEGCWGHLDHLVPYLLWFQNNNRSSVGT